MRRIAKLLGWAVGLLAVWLAALQLEVSRRTHILILLAPVISVAAFGVYSVVLLLYGVLTFSDRPEEGRALKQDVDRARRDLTAKGILEPG
ncbi:hypothetical protein WJX73_005401 [Symbiochloris irregularis]|uniref:Dolichol-phosphate mannosyltransferase subunit 3 n=1 Tax=Symbiochloris irregularis TaxID=706552 RepID=A0AAW1PEJ3_9CHLO